VIMVAGHVGTITKVALQAPTHSTTEGLPLISRMNYNSCQALQSLDAKIASKEKVQKEQEVLDRVCYYSHEAQHHWACKLHCDTLSSWILKHPPFLLDQGSG
jgi:hypothetical protein